MSMLTEEVSKQKMLETIHYMTENFPYRLAGSPCEAAASRYVTERLRQYGLEVENKEFYTYNSDPMYSKVTVLDPAMEIDSLPCAHIRATKPEGEVFELIYVGNGDYASYKDINVKGKMVLVEVSYAPPVPEKARIAYEMGAAGIMCMNWGNDEEVICRRGLKGVWGNPTEANFHCIPEIVGVGVTRGAGLKLKQLCLEGKKVEVKVTAIADRTWSIVHQPMVHMEINGKLDGYMIDICRSTVVGKASEEQIYILETTLEMLEESVAAMHPGVVSEELEKISGSIALAHGFTSNHTRAFGGPATYLGHAIGLGVDEPPVLAKRDKTVLIPGMVITVEPGLYQTGHGGCRIEDEVLVTETGTEILNTFDRRWWN